MSYDALRTTCLSILRANAEHTIGVPISDPSPPRNHSLPPSSILSSEESDLLSSYDTYSRLRLLRQTLEEEIQLYESPSFTSSDAMDLDNSKENDDELRSLQTEVTISKAKAMYKDKVVEHVLITRPILRAVHSGKNSLQHESNLLPYLRTRDLLSTQLLHLHQQRKVLQDGEWDGIRDRLIIANDKNVELAKRLKELEALEEMKNSVRTGRTVEKEVMVRQARMRWDTIRGVVSGVIVGSGVDWARDEKLSEVVWECGGD